MQLPFETAPTFHVDLSSVIGRDELECAAIHRLGGIYMESGENPDPFKFPAE